MCRVGCPLQPLVLMAGSDRESLRRDTRAHHPDDRGFPLDMRQDQALLVRRTVMGEESKPAH